MFHKSCTTIKPLQNHIHVWRMESMPRAAMTQRCTPSVAPKPYRCSNRSLAKVLLSSFNRFVWNTWKAFISVILCYQSKNENFWVLYYGSYLLRIEELKVILSQGFSIAMQFRRYFIKYSISNKMAVGFKYCISNNEIRLY